MCVGMGESDKCCKMIWVVSRLEKCCRNGSPFTITHFSLLLSFRAWNKADRFTFTCRKYNTIMCNGSHAFMTVIPWDALACERTDNSPLLHIMALYWEAKHCQCWFFNIDSAQSVTPGDRYTQCGFFVKALSRIKPDSSVSLTAETVEEVSHFYILHVCM